MYAIYIGKTMLKLGFKGFMVPAIFLTKQKATDYRLYYEGQEIFKDMTIKKVSIN